MPSKTKTKNAAITAKTAALPTIPKELIEQFVKGPMTAEAEANYYRHLPEQATIPG